MPKPIVNTNNTMRLIGLIKLLSLTPLIISSAQGLANTTVYKTVDENGVVSFSDTPPAGQANSETMVIDTPKVSSSPEGYKNRLEDMRETTDRMAADRREREKHQAELRAIKNKSNSDQPSPQPYTENYYPIYAGGNNNRRHHHQTPWRPGYRPTPEHPIARPPLRPDHPVYTDRNSQLMRPIVSKKR